MRAIKIGIIVGILAISSSYADIYDDYKLIAKSVIVNKNSIDEVNNKILQLQKENKQLKNTIKVLNNKLNTLSSQSDIKFKIDKELLKLINSKGINYDK